MLITMFLAVFLTALTTPAAWAIPISIVNPGFEDPILADGARISPTFTAGWQFTGGNAIAVNGVWNPSAAQAYGGIAPEGQNIAFDNGQCICTFFQTLSAVLAPNTTYTLQALVSSYRNPPFNPFPGYSISLYAGSIGLAGYLTRVTPLEGTFSLVTATGTSDASVISGTPLTIQLSKLGSGGEILWDQVTLDARSIPEPASLWLLACGVGALLVSGRWVVL